MFNPLLETVTVFAESDTENTEISSSKGEETQENLDSSTVNSETEVDSTESQETTASDQDKSVSESHSNFKQTENTQQNNSSQMTPRFQERSGEVGVIPSGLTPDNELVKGQPSLTRDDTWWTVTSHIFTRRVIDNYLSAQLKGQTLGFRKGDTLTIPLVVNNSEVLDFSSGMGGKSRHIKQGRHFYTFQNLVPSWNLRDNYVAIGDANIDSVTPLLALSWRDIPSAALDSNWTKKNYQSAYGINSGNSLHIKSSASGSLGDSISYKFREGEIEFTRTKTTFSPEKNNQTQLSEPIRYVFNYVAADYQSVAGLSTWYGVKGEGSIGSYTPRIAINSEQPSKIEAKQDKAVEVNLGESLDWAKINLNDVIKIVKRNDGTQIKMEADDYSKLFQTVGEQIVNVKVTETLDGSSQSTTIPLKVNVKWGSAVLLKGLGDKSIGTVALNHYTYPWLTFTQGKPTSGTIHDNYTKESYYDLRLLRPTNSPQILGKQETGTAFNSLQYAQGHEDILGKIARFGDNSNGYQQASYGDILQVWHAEAGKRERLMVNGTEEKENDDQEYVYYEITKAGFVPLRANQLRPKKGTLPFQADDAYLMKHIDDYIDKKNFQNIEVKQFVTKPDTSKAGETKGEILVEETLTSGKKVQWKYEVPFTIIEDKTKLELQNVDLYVGQTFDPNSPFKNVTDKDGNKLKAKDIEWYYIDGKKSTTKTIDTKQPGTHKVKIWYKDATGTGKYSNEVTVTVKEDKTKLELQNVDLYVGQTFDPDSPFKNVTDKDGNKLKAKDIEWYYIDGKKSTTKTIDTKQPGTHKVKIWYKDATGTGKYSDEITVTVKEYPALTAELISQEAILGEPISKFDLKKSVKNVKLDDKVLAPNDYTIKKVGNGRFSVKGSRTWQAIITTTDGKYSLKVKLPFSVKWGSSILLKGYSSNSIGAITLHQKDGNNLELTDVVGKTRDSADERIHYGFYDDKYYDIRLLGVPTIPQKLTSLKPVTKRNSLTWGRGNDNAQDKINDFGDSSNGVQKANVGDILEVTHEEPKDRESLIVNEKETHENKGQKLVYYELTKDGFSPVRVNQLRMRDDISVISHMTNNDLEKELKADPGKYVENPNKFNNVKLVGFVKYPDTSKLGKQPATIRFEESLKSGKKVQFDYDIQIDVDDKWVNVTIPTKMLFYSDMKGNDKGAVLSENYSITNNSDNTALEIEMASFSVGKDSEVTYLSSVEEDPKIAENKLRLNLLVNDQLKVQSLNSKTKAIKLIDLDFKTSAKLTFEGKYFNANSEDSSEAKSSMVLKFNIKR